MSDLAGVLTLSLPASAPDDVVVVAPDESIARIPTFVSAAGVRKVRFRTPVAGRYRVRAMDGAALDEVDAVGAKAPAPGLQRVGRQLATQDGEPFLWLADTWWYALCDRLEFSEMTALAERRRAEGFTVIQLVAGLLPEVYGFDELGSLDGVWPWTHEYGELDPAWWDAADLRVAAIAAAGLVPAVVGAWSYYLLDMGRDRMERHWREIVARWSALPVVWCTAGEAGMPRYEQVSTPEEEPLIRSLSDEWGEITGSLRKLDPYANLRTLHPYPHAGVFSSTAVLQGDVADLDFIWLQTGHGDRAAIPASRETLAVELAADHGLPVLNSEVCYEGIGAGCSDTLQRFLFWSNVLSGAAGHSYGAQGLWAFRREQDAGPGMPWGEATWQEAAALPGGTQLGAAAELLRGIGWSTLRPSQSSISLPADDEHPCWPYAARDDDRVVVYFPAASLLPVESGVGEDLADVHLTALQPGSWSLMWWNPRRLAELETRTVEVGADGRGPLGSVRDFTALPSTEDWVLVAERIA
jgi:hypothetical protein